MHLISSFPTYILFAFILEHCASLLHVEPSDIDHDCQRPFISLSYFDINSDSHTNNKSLGESFLKYLNSSDNLHQESEIPFQYLLLTCTAPFPIEWIGDVPQQNYLFSYILNDEVRYITPLYSTGAVEDSAEITLLRIHIGNETLAWNNLSSITISCQPIIIEKRNNYEYREDSSCKESTTVTVSTRKYNKMEFVEGKEKTEISTKIVIQFGKDFPHGAQRSGHVCHATEENVRNEWLICDETVNDGRANFVYPSSSSSSKCPGTIPQLKLNVSELSLPSGFLSCHGVGNDNALNEEEFKSSHFSTFQYYHTLPKLCPEDDATLPHLYIENQKPPEAELMTFCIKYTSPMHKNNVVDEGGGGGPVTYVGENITISCFSSIPYCAQGLRILQGTGANESILDISNSSREISNGLQGYRNMTVTITVSKDKGLDVLQCKAPLRKSRSWLTRTIKTRIKDPVKLSFEETHETFLRGQDGTRFLLCNASGDPLPILSWSRLNHEKLPNNQSTISSSSWIASKLYFPKSGGDAKNGTEAEYIGRYICGAINQFDSIEKIFIFSGKDSQEIGEESGVSSVGKIWITVVASVSIILLASLVILMGCKLRRQSNNFRLFTKAEMDDFIFGKPGLLLNDSENYEEINSYAAYLPYDKNQFEIRREQLEFDTKDVLGSGAYGTVYKGIFKDTSENKTLVAIKTVNESSDKMHFAALLSEIKIMCYVGKHENIVGLVGACTKYLDQRQIYVATELCENGDLLSYILKHSDAFRNNAGKEESGKWREEKGKLSDGYCKLAYASLSLLLSPHLLLVWALQISNGMLFLSSKKVIHSDLALRNVLLMADLRPKIGDFGLSKQLQKYSSYVRKGDDLLPWRWLSIEALQFLKFSIKSDVWAFGVILYELFTLGQVPYATYTYSELFLVALCQGERLRKPFLATEKLYELMMNCWKHSPEDRPSFQSVHNTLRILLLESESRLMSKSDHSEHQPEAVKTENDELKTKLGLGQYVNTVDDDYEIEDELSCSNYTNDSTIKGKENEMSQTPNCEKIPEFQVSKNLSDTEMSVRKLETLHFTMSSSVTKGSSAYVGWNEVTS